MDNNAKRKTYGQLGDIGNDMIVNSHMLSYSWTD
jgi:hypothetical protein